MTMFDDDRGQLPPPTGGPLAPPPTGRALPAPGGFNRFRDEVMAGGAVTERSTPDGEPLGGGVSGAVAGVMILALFAWLAVVSQWAFLFVLGIFVSVFLHETGHFVTARLTGMKATQFFIGFGPRLWSFHRGETEYGVRLLPLGAFVRIVGMNNLDDVPPADEARTYRQATFPRRLLVISAGSIMHVLIAIALFFAVFASRGELVEISGAEVSGVSAGSGAAAAGIRADDVIMSIAGVDVEPGTDVGEIIRRFEPGDTVAVSLLRNGEQLSVDATLGANPIAGELNGTALLGIRSSGRAEWREMSVGAAARRSVTDLVPATWDSTKGIVQVLNPVNIVEHLSGANADLSTRPTTVAGVTGVAGDVGERDGLAGVLYLLAALNVFVGVFNMFPLLPLDGGHAAIAIYERVREIGRGGRRYFTDVAKLMPFAMGVIVVLLFLFMSGLYLDITDPL
jgi:membrane-associated protease RseP (regulator of RpoE activity)